MNSTSEEYILQKYNFVGKLETKLAIQQNLTSITFKEHVPLGEIDYIFCALLDANGGFLDESEFASLLGFNIIDNPSKKLYKDQGEIAIFQKLIDNIEEYALIERLEIEKYYTINSLKIRTQSKKLIARNLQGNIKKYIITEKFNIEKQEYVCAVKGIKITPHGKKALENNLKEKCYKGKIKTFKGNVETNITTNFPFHFFLEREDILDIEYISKNKQIKQREFIKTISHHGISDFEQLAVKSIVQKEGYELESFDKNIFDSYIYIPVEYRFFRNNETCTDVMLAYYKDEFSKEITQVINDLCNIELKAKLINDIIFKKICNSQNLQIDSFTITKFSDRWNWSNLVKQNLDWADINLLDTFLHKSFDIWDTLSQIAPIEIIQDTIQRYNKWNSQIISERLSENFILDNLFNYKWDFEILANRDIEFSKKVVRKIISHNNLLEQENKLISNYNLYSVTEQLDDEFIEEVITENILLNYTILSQKEPNFVLYLITKLKDFNDKNDEYLHIIPSWNWNFITSNWQLATIWNNIELIKENINWHIFLCKIFEYKKIKDYFLSHEVFIKILDENIQRVSPRFSSEKLLWDSELINFLDSKNLILWTSLNVLGFECNDVFSKNIELFGEFKDKISSNKGRAVLSENIISSQFLYKFPNFEWNWEVILLNSNIEKSYLLIDTFKDNWNWKQISKILSEEFIIENINSFVELWDYTLLSERLNDNFIIQNIDSYSWDFNILLGKTSEFIEKAISTSVNSTITWNWKEISKIVSEEFIIENINSFVELWDYTVLSERINDEFIIKNLNDYSWDFNILSSKTTEFIQRAIQANQNYTIIWDWEKISSFDLDEKFIKQTLPILNDKYQSEKPKAIITFWKKTTYKLDFDFIQVHLKDFEFEWDWTYITKNLDKDDTVRQLEVLADYLDWNYITKDLFSKEEIYELLINSETNYKFSKYWNWKYIIEDIFTLEDLSDTDFFKKIAYNLAYLPSEEGSSFWTLLTAKLTSNPHLVRDYMDLGLIEEDIKLDYNILSNYSKFKEILTYRFLKKYKDKWNWIALSKNKEINYRFNYLEDLAEFWDWEYISEYSSFLQSNTSNKKYEAEGRISNIKTITRFFKYINWNALSSRSDIVFDSKFINKFIDKWDYKNLSQNKNLKITPNFLLKKHSLEWDYEALSKNSNISFYIFPKKQEHTNNETEAKIEEKPIINILLELKDKPWDWKALSTKENLTIDIALIEATIDKDWDWKSLTKKIPINKIEPYLEILKEKDIDWEYIQQHKQFECNEVIVQKYENKWNWNLISSRKDVKLSLEFVLEYKDKWNYYLLSKNTSLLDNFNIVANLQDKNWNFSYFSTQSKIIENIEFIRHFEDRFDWNIISKNINNLSSELVEEFKWKWNYNELLKRNGNIKSYAEQSIEINPMIKFAAKIQDVQRTDYPQIYHFTHLSNAVKILKEMCIKSRNTANQINNSAGTVIESNTKGRVYARFYYRNDTPAQFYNQNFGTRKNTSVHISMGLPICPIPIFFKINMQEVMQKNSSIVYFSDGNLQANFSNVNYFSNLSIERFNFGNLLSTNYKNDKQAIQQEFLVRDGLDLNGIKDIEIICQNNEHKDILINLIGKNHPLLPYIQVDRNIYVHGNVQTNIVLDNNTVNLSFNGSIEGNVILVTKNSLNEEQERVEKIEHNHIAFAVSENEKYKIYFKDTKAPIPQKWLLYDNTMSS